MNNIKNKWNKVLNSKKTAIILTVFVLTPFLIFGAILIRDSMQKGKPVVGSRNDAGLASAITNDDITKIEGLIADDMILESKVTLKSSTFRVYAKVSSELSKDVMKEIGDKILTSINEVLPMDPYFTTTESNKQYDLEIHVYNDVEDRDGDDFVYYQMIHSSVGEEMTNRFVSDAKDEEYKKEILELEKARLEKLEEAKQEEESGEE